MPLNIRQAAAFCFFYPFIRISVSVENNSLMFCQIFLNQIMNSHIKVLCLFQHIGSLTESFCHNGIQCCIRAGNGVIRTYHTEFKLIPCKSEG